MTLGAIATKARFLTNTDTNSYPDSVLLVDIDIWLQKVASMMFDLQDDSCLNLGIPWGRRSCGLSREILLVSLSGNTNVFPFTPMHPSVSVGESHPMKRLFKKALPVIWKYELGFVAYF